MRSDGLPWFYDEVYRNPPESGSRKHSNYTIDQFGDIVSQCAWMHQGRFLKVSDTQENILQLPFALVPLKSGMKMYNNRTGTEYTITQVLEDYRASSYQEPTIKNTPESTRIAPRLWRSGFHPDELTGATVQVESPVFDLDPKQGDFLSIESSARIVIRQEYAEMRGDIAGSNLEDHSDYLVQYNVERHEPNYDTEPFGDFKGRKATRRPVELETDDPTLVAVMEGQFFDSIVCFKLESQNGHELNLMTQWFEMFMERYRPVYERLGFNRVLYWAREQGSHAHRDNPMQGTERKIKYYIRSERLWPGKGPKLRVIDVAIEPKTQE